MVCVSIPSAIRLDKIPIPFSKYLIHPFYGRHIGWVDHGLSMVEGNGHAAKTLVMFVLREILTEATMPKFTIRTEEPSGKTSTAASYPNEESAAADAQRVIAEMAKDNLPDGEHLRLNVAVDNEKGEEIFQASIEFTSRWREQANRPCKK